MQINPKRQIDSILTADDSVPITDYETERNRFEIVCGSCGRVFYADEQAADFFNRHIKHDLDRPFLCSGCDSEIHRTADQER